MDNRDSNTQQHANVADSDVINIAASLQALLGIPPISKTTSSNTNQFSDTQISKSTPPSFASILLNANTNIQQQQQQSRQGNCTLICTKYYD